MCDASQILARHTKTKIVEPDDSEWMVDPSTLFADSPSEAGFVELRIHVEHPAPLFQWWLEIYRIRKHRELGIPKEMGFP